MNWLWGLTIVFVVLGSLLALAESSLTRMTRVRALSLQEEGRRNAALLVKLETDPPRYLNSVYLSVMIVQNGSAVLVAFLAERSFGGARGHARLAGASRCSTSSSSRRWRRRSASCTRTAWRSPSRRSSTSSAASCRLPTRALIGLANVLLPGRGLKQGPFVSEEEIRSMAQVGSEEGSIEEGEKELIHSIFEFGDTIVREVMVPRPDIVAIEDDKSLRDVQALVLEHGYSRVPVYHEDLDNVIGIIYAKDVLKALHQGKHDAPLNEIVRETHFIPETKKVAELLREMQRDKFHIALVTDEYGSVSGLVTLEDLLEELVGRDRRRVRPRRARAGARRRRPLPRVGQGLDRRRERAARRRAAGRGVGHRRGSDARAVRAHPQERRRGRVPGADVHRRGGPGPADLEGADRDGSPDPDGQRDGEVIHGMSPMGDDILDGLVAAASEARERFYAPYSGFAVGAAILAGGTTFVGVNIENASYPLSVCAERNAVAAMIVGGQRRIEAVAVVAGGETVPRRPAAGVVRCWRSSPPTTCRSFPSTSRGSASDGRWASCSPPRSA